MFVPFENLSDSASIWIYPSHRKFTAAEKNTISTHLRSFTNQWTAHNQSLQASFSVLYDQFIVLAVDEGFNQASGCSIDASVHALQQLASRIHIDFFSRKYVAFSKNNEVHLVPLSDLKRRLEEGEWNQETLVFNNNLLTKSELSTKWIVPSGETWLKKYLNKTPA